MRLFKRGAEADIYITEWNRRPAVLKVRKPKPYINAELDARIRRTRTVREAQIMAEVKRLGISAPLVYDLDAGSDAIVMQHVRGTAVSSMRGARLAAACALIGSAAARLHRGGLVHGDMTTSNFVVRARRLFMLDLGLASRTARAEDHAVDLRLLKEVLNSAHAPDMAKSWRAFCSAYASAAGARRSARILRIVADIERRGRYATVV